MTNRQPLHLPLSAPVKNRDAATRENDEALAAARQDPRALFLVLWRGDVLLESPVNSGDGSGFETNVEPSAAAGERPRIRLVPSSEVPGTGEDFFLGRQDGLDSSGAPIFVRVLREEPDPVHPFMNLRSMAHELSAEDAALCVEAVAVQNWQARYGFSPTTGRETVVKHGGWMREDPESGEQFFPRTDPAVIVLVRDTDDRVLLGSNVLWETGRFSLLAGFVEAGESLEAAVAREVLEESGLRIVDPVYRGSQPWPFPRSLMLGFEARIAPDEDPLNARPDGQEIVDLRWVSRADILADDSTLILPGKSSIARALLDAWLAEEQ
ncbi:NAD(+) diphosphatase [Lysinibacter cavernae]|uniref:NAD(+) diphosphatase n=1 Tax=Lysinibacter cavernae TaxID=1640652 RepID=A0A7X5TSG3_9MICO|nr:NAD(+) diphosphatase [Lysinibacter cavernae]NIH52359.1 NAD+ diphosphatase [Lysinibacter cavernae]